MYLATLHVGWHIHELRNARHKYLESDPGYIDSGFPAATSNHICSVIRVDEIPRSFCPWFEAATSEAVNTSHLHFQRRDLVIIAINQTFAWYWYLCHVKLPWYSAEFCDVIQVKKLKTECVVIVCDLSCSKQLTIGMPLKHASDLVSWLGFFGSTPIRRMVASWQWTSHGFHRLQ